MKILHTSDWHLGKRLEGFSRLEEQIEVLEEIYTITEKENINAIIIAGDLFDSFNPGVEAVELFYKTLKKMTNNGKRAVIAIAGNHDSPDRIEAPDPLALECGIIFAGYPKVKINKFSIDSGLKLINSEPGFVELVIPDINYPLRIILTPYANEIRLKKDLGINNSNEELKKILENKWQELSDKYCDQAGVNILVSHLYITDKEGESIEEPEEEKPILHPGGVAPLTGEIIPENIQYAAFGHLHRENIFDNGNTFIAYSGSPLAYSMSEENQDKYVIITDINPGKKAECKKINIKKGRKLLRKRFESIDNAVSFLKSNPEILIELTIVSDNYLTTKDRKQLYNSHDGIITIIPEVKTQKESINDRKKINLEKSIEELFIDYFIEKNSGQTPDENLLKLFKEILSVERSE
jgi:exonuclease SbcD